MDEHIKAFAVPSKGGKRKRVSGAVAIDKQPEPIEGVVQIKFHNLDGAQVARLPCGPKETVSLSGSKGCYVLTKT